MTKQTEQEILARLGAIEVHLNRGRQEPFIGMDRLDDAEFWFDARGGRNSISNMSTTHISNALYYLRSYYKHDACLEDRPVVKAFKNRLHAEANRIENEAKIRSDCLRAIGSPR